MSVTKFKPPDSCTSNENGPECRICLAQLGVDERVYNLFDTWCPPWDGMESTIAEDLNLLTNIQVNKEDILSNTICRSCKERLQNACDFVKFAQKNDLMLKRANSLQPESEFMWPKPIELEKNIEGHILENSMVMEIDIKQEVDSEEDEYSISGMEGGSTDLNAEIKVEPEEMVLPDITPAVQINGSVPSSSKRMKLAAKDDRFDVKFLEPVIKEEPLSEEDIETLGPEMPLECMLCFKTFNSITGLKAHVIALHSYKTVKRKHMNSISPAKKDRKTDKYVCATCKRTFFTSTDLMVHETCHSKLTCYVCHQKFDNFNQLMNHKKRCKGTETPKPKKLDDVKRLPADEVKPEKKNFSCPTCSELFTDAYYMKLHQEIHNSATNSEPVTKSDQINQTMQYTGETLEGVDATLNEANETFGGENETPNNKKETVYNINKEINNLNEITCKNEVKIPNVTAVEDNQNKVCKTFESSIETLRNDYDYVTTQEKDLNIKISEISSDFNLHSVSGEKVNVTSNNEEETIENINKEVENTKKDIDDPQLTIKISQITSDVDEDAFKISETVKSLTETLQNASETIQYVSECPDKKVKEATGSVHEYVENLKVPLGKTDEVETPDHLYITPETDNASLNAVNQTSESGNEQVIDENKTLDQGIEKNKRLKRDKSTEIENKTQAGTTESVADKNTLKTLNETLESLKVTPKKIIGTITKVESDKLEAIFGVVSTDSKSEVDL